MKKLTFYCFVCVLINSLTAKAQQAEIYGTITSEENQPIPETYLYINGTTIYTRADENGKYSISVDAGDYKFAASAMGYIKTIKEVSLEPAERKRIDFVLPIDPDMTLSDVSLIGKSALKEIQESSYNVVALNAEGLHNTTLDISQALERVSGIRVRRSGGLGSDANLMLNGFTGRHVKMFIDGVPMEGFNSAFSMNNIPINLAKRIEVYKGVVPINFGSDALGGAINIVTEDGKQNFLDASYSYGSFNTHKSFLNTAYTSDSGITARLTAFQNYSDNDYKVDAGIVELEGEGSYQFSGERQNVRRFHDMYRNYTLMGKVGVVNKSYADQLLLGFTYGDEFNEVQHPAYMNVAFGQIYETAETLMPSLTYRKKDLFTKNLNVSLQANYNFGESSYIDAANRDYNWLGEYVEKDALGEYQYSRRFFKNRNGSVNANATYKFNDKHAFTVNNVFSAFSRKGTDLAEPSPADDYPSENFKNVLGVGYKFQPNDAWSTSVFGKYYSNTVNQYAAPEGNDEYENYSRFTDTYGYGIASSYFITESLQFKASYENAVRLPTGRELFGSGSSFELGNPNLRPESSDNINVGANYNWILAKDHTLNLDASFIYRDTEDFIRRQVNSEGAAASINEASVENRGIDFEALYTYGNLFSANASFTYQDQRNTLEYRNNGSRNLSYDQRIPNQPYLFGNAGFSFFFDDMWKSQDRFSVNYNMLYIHEFSYDYSGYGNSATNINIPTQFAHDIYLNYSLKGGKYNISLECRNILDENLYDNYSLQKPGRSFAVKLRYFIDKF